MHHPTAVLTSALHPFSLVAKGQGWETAAQHGRWGPDLDTRPSEGHLAPQLYRDAIFVITFLLL